MKLEEIIPLVGNFGRYQLFVVLYAGVLSAVGGMVTFADVFFAAETDHWCQVLPKENCSSWVEFQDNCTDVKKSILLPPPENEDSKYPYSTCQQWDLPPGYEFDPYEPPSDVENHTYGRVPCKDGWEYDTSQYETTTISDFDLVCDKKSLRSLAQSIYFAGFLVGSFIFGSLSDWIGRKKTVIFGLLLLACGAIVTTFSVNIYMYMAFRFVAGFGNMGFYIPLYVLVIEFVGNSWRTAATMALGILYACGYFFLATAAMYIRDWRRLSMIVSLPLLPLFVPVLFIQESVSWLVSKGRIDEAEVVIRRVAKINRKTLPDVLFDRDDIKDETESKTSAIPPSVIDLFKTPNMAAKTTTIMINWTVNNLVYYGLAQSTDNLGVDEYWAFFVSGAVDIPALIYATFGVEWFGRKRNTAVLELIAGIACLATIFIPLGIWRTVVAMIGKFGVSASYSIIYLYTSELFPTPVRSIGVGMGAVAAQLGGILSPIILLLGDYLESLPLIVFGSSAVLAGLLVLLLPETKGRKLPQTLEEGEEIGKCRCMRRTHEEDTAPVSENGDRPDEESALNLPNPAFLYTKEEEVEIGV
ncbi:organic cation transporter protein-like [Patiria miniata]|uniref:Major facilitator superfamily (MFS) profile domain-containing protein n=1 Tax=Patiria miniata TaxID=46514 RepID=A0A914BPL3_PATMI|nr:organic cation transporter protein-like [Patiria miniata]XP_038078077.1 organic cation transporter protein-like [Patiria miniata]XP_038078078.1 organic cation transporter protein-like [Patiria miniata]XP_038078079.1 organic cation transporter protein-like [Patiria miniata]